ncbi:MAG: MFS transporter, partial [Deltaproteobacteria bacterium]|nr:MFS transporter [Deltaproteobacteria bacterium]
NKIVEKFPFWAQILYSSGNIGIFIADRVWVTFMLYFYLPPAESGMPELISNRTFLGFLTVAGLVTIFGRTVDAIADPLVAAWSDRSKSKLGRRKMFLTFGGLPLMLASVLLFFPPSSEPGTANAIYMAIMLGILLFFFTFYTAPWLALIPELSHTDRERINIVTLQAVFSLIGTVIVMVGGYLIWGKLESSGMDKTSALQFTVVILGFIGLIFCYLAVIPINEKRYCASVPSDTGLVESIKLTFSNRPFLLYLFGTMCLIFGVNIISQTAPYYVTVLLQKKEAFASSVFGAIFVVALIFFPIINLLCRYIEKRIIMIIGLSIFAICSFLLYFLGTETLPFSPINQAFIIFGLIGIPVSIVFIVLNAIVSDLAEYDAIKTGSKREAMYFGAQGFLMKINLGISTLILAFLFSGFGKDLANPLGVKLSGPVAALVCAIGIILFMFYPEKKIMDVLEENRRTPKEM